MLPFELRQKSRLRTTVAGGEETGLFLERGSVLRDGVCAPTTSAEWSVPRWLRPGDALHCGARRRRCADRARD